MKNILKQRLEQLYISHLNISDRACWGYYYLLPYDTNRYETGTVRDCRNYTHLSSRSELSST